MPNQPFSAAVFGASGGIGAALVAALAQMPGAPQVCAGARRELGPLPPGVRSFRFDLTDEASIAAAGEEIGEVDWVIVATGLLADPARGIAPERSWQALDGAAMARAFAINTIGPALIAKHVLPRLPRGRRSVFAVLSAKVGSIGDNRLGGWHSYRASKAALNMLIANFALELTHRRPQAIAVALHPGTVETPLSAPFTARTAPGQLVAPAAAAARLLGVMAGLTPEDSGRLINWDGTMLPW